MKTAELLNEWLTTYERERVKPRTYARYEGLINLHIAPALGQVEINELCRRQIQEFLTKKKKDGNVKQSDDFHIARIFKGEIEHSQHKVCTCCR